MASTTFTDGVTLTDDEWFNHVNDAVYEVMGDGTTPPSTAVSAMKNLFKKGADIASAATVNLATATGNYVHITGTVTITSLGTVNAGVPFWLVFDGALTLTHNATSLILLTSANRVTVANDVGLYISEGSGNWREVVFGNIAGSGASLPFVDTNPVVVGSDDATKKLRFEVDGITTATTRVLTIQDADGTIALTSDLVGGLIPGNIPGYLFNFYNFG